MTFTPADLNPFFESKWALLQRLPGEMGKLDGYNVRTFLFKAPFTPIHSCGRHHLSVGLFKDCAAAMP